MSVDVKKTASALIAVVVALGWMSVTSAWQAPAAGAPKRASVNAATKTVPCTPDGHPDLQGIWDAKSATPLERPREFAGREFLTDEEVKQLEDRAEERGRTGAGRPVSIHPSWWLDYGTKIVPSHRTSLIVDPPDGRMPALTPEAQKRAAAARTTAASHGSLDDPKNLNLWERCVTREVPEGMLPGPYNSNIQIVQIRRPRHDPTWR